MWKVPFLAWAWLLIAVPSHDFTTARPPSACIFLQRTRKVHLSWEHLPGKRFRLTLESPTQTLSDQVILGNRADLQVPHFRTDYRWSVTALDAKATAQGSFRVADTFCFDASGADATTPGQHGKNGSSIQVKLSRTTLGMTAWLRRGQQEHCYVFNDPEVRLLIVSRGGNGTDGQSSDHLRGQDGGDAGFGGTVTIIATSSPWRRYLDIDNSPGKPGRGGLGGIRPDGSPQADGVDGKPGRPGPIVTEVRDWVP